MSRPSPILIAGPTASGKSALAVLVAERLNGVVVNADSMQVYRELRILTARPSLADEARVPHVLYGHVPAAEAYSAGRFISEMTGILRDCAASKRRPVIVGGTGLYFKALLEGLSPIPEVREDVRAHWRSQAARTGAAALHEVLCARDAVMAARLEPSDTQRIVRALEVLDSSGRSLSYWQQQPGTPLIGEAAARRFVLLPEREVLHARADARFDQMMQQGAMDEVSALAAKGLAPELPAMRALGVAPLRDVLAESGSLDDAVDTAKAQTRQYIKRQETWLRRNMIAWNKLDAQETECNLREIVSFIQS